MNHGCVCYYGAHRYHTFGFDIDYSFGSITPFKGRIELPGAGCRPLSRRKNKYLASYTPAFQIMAGLSNRPCIRVHTSGKGYGHLRHDRFPLHNPCSYRPGFDSNHFLPSHLPDIAVWTHSGSLLPT